MPTTYDLELTSPKTGRSYSLTVDRVPAPEDIDYMAEHLDRVAAEQEAAKPGFRLGDAVSGIGDAVSGLTTTLPAAYHRLTEGLRRPDQYSPEARAAFDTEAKYARKMQTESTQRLMRGEASSTGDAFRAAGPSLGFSGASMAAAIPAGMAGAKLGALGGGALGTAVPVLGNAAGATAGGLIGGAAGAMTAAGGAAYRMAGAQFLDDAFKQLQYHYGRELNEAEKQDAYAHLLPLAQDSALWEAGPEAVANAVGLGMGKIVLGLGKPLITKLATTALGKAGIKLGAVGVGVGTELATETATQLGQGLPQAQANAYVKGEDMATARSPYDKPGGTLQALADVTPQTLALSGLMLGAGGAVKATQSGINQLRNNDNVSTNPTNATAAPSATNGTTAATAPVGGGAGAAVPVNEHVLAQMAAQGAAPSAEGMAPAQTFPTALNVQLPGPGEQAPAAPGASLPGGTNAPGLQVPPPAADPAPLTAADPNAAPLVPPAAADAAAAANGVHLTAEDSGRIAASRPVFPTGSVLAQAAAVAQGQQRGVLPANVRQMLQPAQQTAAPGGGRGVGAIFEQPQAPASEGVALPSPALLAAAHAAATVGSSTPMVPIRAVYEQAAKLQPGLTPEAFMQAVQKGDGEGIVYLEPANTMAVINAAGGFVVPSQSGPAVGMMMAPPQVSMSRPHVTSLGTAAAGKVPAYFVAESTGQPIFTPHEIHERTVSRDQTRDPGELARALGALNSGGTRGEHQRAAHGASRPPGERSHSKGLESLSGPRLAQGLAGLKHHPGGEHDVYLDPEHGVAVKLTRPGEFGAEDQGLPGYLKRLHESNVAFNDHVQVMGEVQFPNEAGPRVVTIQPLRLADPAKPEPTQKEIDVYMRVHGFLKAYDGAYLHETKDLAASDAVPKNFVHDIEGKLHAVDVIVITPDGDQSDRLQNQVYNQEQVPDSALPKPGVTPNAAGTAVKLLEQEAPGITNKVTFVADREALKQGDYHPDDWRDLQTAEGFYHRGEVVVILRNVVVRPNETPTRAIARVILHERVGHAGLAALRKVDAKFAKQWDALVKSVMTEPKHAAQRTEIEELRSQGYDHLNESQLVEEWFARQAEQKTATELGKLQPGIFKRMWLALRDALARITGSFKRQDWLNAEVKELMERSRAALAQHDEGGVSEGGRVKQAKPTVTSEQEQRVFGQRVRVDERLDPAMRERFGEPIFYDVAHNADTLAAANAFIEKNGLNAAADVLFDMQQNIPAHVRVTLGQQLLLRLDRAARAVAQQGDREQAKQIYDLAYQVSNFTDELGTQAGQAVQAFAMWARMTPEGLLMQFDQRLKDLNDGVTPALPAEMLKQLGDLRDKANALPQDSLIRTDVMRELMATMARYEGVPIAGVLTSLWYANLLSGLTTQGVNVWGNGLNLTARTIAAGMVNHPRDTLAMLSGMLKAWPKAKEEALAALKGRQISKGAVRYDLPTVDKYAQLNALEIALSEKPKNWQSWVAWIGSIGGLTKYVFRFLQASDAVFWHTAFEGRAHLAASRAARQGHKPGTAEYAQAMAEMLGSGTARFAAAMQQAETELKEAGLGSNESQVRRRAWEIVDQQRPQEVRAEAARFGDMLTYQQDPEGSGKWIYNTILRFQSFKPLGVPIFKPLVPFARIPANIWSNGLDFTPVGILRGIAGSHLADLGMDLQRKAGVEEMAAWERKERIAAGIMGSITGAIVWQMAAAAMAGAEDDDESVPFMVYGAGRGSKDKNATMPPGWKPYTLKVGSTYWSYAESPLAFVMAPIGAWYDAKRYKLNLSEKSWSVRADYMARAVAGAVLSQGVLSSLGDVMDVINGKTQLSKLPARYTAGFIPASGLLRDITPLFDPVKISDETVLSSIFRDVPVVRNMVGRPALNIFGEPVVIEGLNRIPVVKRFVATVGDHPSARFLARHNLSIPGFEQHIEMGTYLTSAEKSRMLDAQHLARLDGNLLTPDEHYQLVKRSGELTLQAVKQLTANYEQKRVRPDADDLRVQLSRSHSKEQATEHAIQVTLQKQLDKQVHAARRVAMKEIATKGR